MELNNRKFATFLRFRNELLQVDEFEKRYGFVLPPVFKSFVTQFEGIHGDVYVDKSDEYKTLTYYQYKAIQLGGKDLLLEDFIPVEDIFKYAKNSDTWIENGVVPLTSHSHGGTILLGILESNSDKLFFEHGEGVQFIEDNIYSFLNNLSFVLHYDGPSDKLYKNWGENFWRVQG